MTSIDSIKKELADEKQKINDAENQDVKKRTIAELIRIEKQHLFGAGSGSKKTKIDSCINLALKKAMEEKDAT